MRRLNIPPPPLTSPPSVGTYMTNPPSPSPRPEGALTNSSPARHQAGMPPQSPAIQPCPGGNSPPSVGVQWGSQDPVRRPLPYQQQQRNRRTWLKTQRFFSWVGGGSPSTPTNAQHSQQPPKRAGNSLSPSLLRLTTPDPSPLSSGRIRTNTWASKWEWNAVSR